MLPEQPHMDDRIVFPLKKDKVAECILYLVGKGLKLDAYKVVKLLYLADRAHLRKYGRPVSFDRYVAMKDGPVASHAYDIMKGNVSETAFPFDVTSHGPWKYAENPKRLVNKKLFSKSDFQVLDETAEKYGHWTFDQLWEETHQHLAYDRVWKNKQSQADAMLFEDFFEGIDNAEELIECVRQVSANMR